MAKTPKHETIRMLVPGESTWELWTQGKGPPVLQKTLKDDEWIAEGQKETLVGLPAQDHMIFAFWVPAAGGADPQEMVALQLEKRGLAGKGGDLTDCRQVAEGQGRKLFTAGLLTEHFPEACCHERLGRLVFSLDYRVLPPNGVVVWRELGRCALAVTRDGQAIYVQSFSGATPLQEIAREALLACMHLQSEEVALPAEAVVLEGSFGERERETMAVFFSCPVRLEPARPPVCPASPRNVLPGRVREARNKRAQGKKQSRLIGAALALYAAFLLFMGGHMAWLQWQIRGLETLVAQDAAEAELVRATALRWEDLESVLFPESYPVEVLFRCTRSLPEEGVRLTRFTQDNGKVTMEGEANNPPAAFQYLDALKSNPDLAGYEWQMPQPKVLPNNSAQFQLEGKRSHAFADRK
jgi:hypothetical protein